MKFNEIDDKDLEKDDFFDGEDIPAPVKEPKKPSLKPDDPQYWDEPESEWEHLRPGRRKAVWVWLAVTGIAAGICLGLYYRYFSPCVDEAVQAGYVESIQKSGTFIKTYEGVILPYKELEDTTRTYTRDFVFSTPDVHVATMLKRMLLENRPVRVEYRIYNATVPWRGETRVIVTKADSVSPDKLLPPEFAPRR